MTKRFTILTLGCKVNQSESESVQEALFASGWRLAEPGATADVCIVNTCTVTHKASMQSRQAIRRAVRAHPDARVVVTGCYAQTEPAVVEKIDGVDHILDQSAKQQLPELLTAGDPSAELSACKPIRDLRDSKRFHELPFTPKSARTRPFLKIQDGCNAFCTYCIVPYARGASRSMAPASVLDRIRDLGQTGFHEVVLTGVHLGYYGRDIGSGNYGLEDLLKDAIDDGGIDQLRLSSIEPGELSNGILNWVKTSQNTGTRICRHFHIPLQSGDDLLLKRMGRPYTSRDFSNLVAGINRILPDAAVGADVLVGFPGETQTAFYNTVALIESLPLSYLHVFPFSPRRGTPAFDYPDHLAPEIIRSRCKILRRLGQTKKKRFLTRMVGATEQVLIERRTTDPSGDYWTGLTSNYASVRLSTDREGLENTFVDAKIDAVTREGTLEGTLGGGR